MTSVEQDVRYALRGFRKQPGFVVMAVVALGLGIGAATAIFSVVENVLFEPFPYREANRIVSVEVHDVTRPGVNGKGAYITPDYLALREQTHSMEEMVGVDTWDFLYTTREGTERLQGVQVTSDTFDFLGVKPLVGRGIRREDGKPGAPQVFVMSYKTWLKYCNGDLQALGKSFRLNNVQRTLVGVMPPRFTYFQGDIWYPHDPDAAEANANRFFFVVQGRIKRGLTVQDAEKDFATVIRRLAKIAPDRYPEKFSIHIENLTDMVVGQFRSTLKMLLAAVGLLLFIGCTNVANMLLARATSREKEISIRSALGASRWRIGRQMLVESALLTSGGLLLGCLLAYAGVKGLVLMLPEDMIPTEAVISLNWRVLLFSFGLAALTTFAAGLVPALHASRRDLADPLKDSGKGVSGGFRRGGLRKLLVIGEIALSLVLLAGAGLMMRTIVALQTADLGLNPENVLFLRLPLPKERYHKSPQIQHFFADLLPRLKQMPGVIAAAATSSVPPYGGILSELDVPGGIAHVERWQAIYELCSEGYFPTLGLRLIEGRILSEEEVTDRRLVAVVNKTLVRKFFRGGEVVGHQIKLKNLATLPDPVSDPTFTIVGVISDAKNQGIQEPVFPEVFIPYTVTGSYSRGILLRTAMEPTTLENAVRREIWAVDRGVALTLMGSVKGLLKTYSYAGPRFALMILAIFAVIGLILVAIGAYSMLAYTVSQQTHEIGIRIALGAGEQTVFLMVLRMGAALISIGLAVGVAASLPLNRLIADQLWGVQPHDPLTMVSVIAIVAVIGTIACLVPARRATRVDPLVSLRHD